MPEGRESGARWGVVVALASLGAFLAMVFLVLGWFAAAALAALASLIGPAVAQARVSENRPP